MPLTASAISVRLYPVLPLSKALKLKSNAFLVEIPLDSGFAIALVVGSFVDLFRSYWNYPCSLFGTYQGLKNR